MAKFHLPSIEEEQLRFWKENGILKRVMDRPSSRPDFVFFEGPPTANGKPGIHHVLARSFKDVVLRYRTMRGHHIDRKAGWDTHGLPVELSVEKQLGFTKKGDIEEYGIAKFNAKCKESVWEYLDVWRRLTERIGFWVDLDHPYITYENDYIETLWWILKQVNDKGLLYQGYRVTPHCPRCVTSLSSHELAQGYKDVDDESVYVKFQVAGEPGRFFLVWTTTPWTLPSNVALALGADVVYAEVKMRASGERFILAKARLGSLDGEYDILGEKTGAELKGTAYEPLYATLDDDSVKKANAYEAYTADFVSTADGTGIVHIAPAYGEDDARLGAAEDLPTLFTVDASGTVTSGKAPGTGKFMKASDADVKADLESRKLLYKSETYRHAYPFCWRCGTPILYFAKNSWYIRMSDLRDRLMAANGRINWVPDYIKEGRFGEWLREVKDWAISRERYWGTPLPVWTCGKCGKREVVGGLDDLKRLARPRNRWFLQRHGEAENNVADTVSGWPEPAQPWRLTEKGRGQAVAAAAKLKGMNIDLIFASDITRTRETAEIIAKELGLPVVYDNRLREVALGSFEGKTVGEFRAYFSSKLERFERPIEGGESLHQVRRRVIGFFKEIEAKYSGKNILVVSHGDPIWMLTSGLKELSDEAALEAGYNHVGEFVEMEYEPGLPRDEMGHVDLHRPFVDEIGLDCPACRARMDRATDVIDCWFDSGAMPFAQWHYPFENKERVDSGRDFPADFISEAIDQTRGWFYTLLAVSTALGHDVPPYRNCICLGHILDAKGQKMSKSKGNVVDPWEMIAKYGADAIRWHFFTMNQPGDVKLFDEKSLDEVTKKVFLILWNVLTFWKMYAGEARAAADEPKPAAEMDRWILAKLNELTAKVTGKMEAYQPVDACRSIGDFVNDLSTWYVRRSRDRFKGESSAEAVATLGHVLLRLSKLMAPFTPFLAEALYKEAGGEKESVHLEVWPEAAVADDGALSRMDSVRRAASMGLEKRAAAGIPVRQVLARASVKSLDKFEDWMKSILAEELNVEAVEAVTVKDAAQVGIELDTALTPELKRKGAARELTRHVNDMRKQAGLTIKDRVILGWDSSSDFWKQVFADAGESLKTAVLANQVNAGRFEAEQSKEIESDGQKLWLGIRKV